MADVDEAAATRDLRRRVRLAFYGLLAADERLALADSMLRLAERVKDVAQARFEEGAAPRLDVMEAELSAVRARAEMDLAQSAPPRHAGRTQRTPEQASGDDSFSRG